MTDETLFANSDKFRRTMELVDKELRNSKEEFILHFKEKYSNPYPPAWILVEILIKSTMMIQNDLRVIGTGTLIYTSEPKDLSL